MSELNFVKNFENNKEEQLVLLNLLRAYAISKKGKFNLPSIIYLDEIGGQLDITRSRAREIAERFTERVFKIPKFDLRTTVSPHMGMFNATADLNKITQVADIKNTVENVGFEEKTINGYKIIATDFVMYYGKFKKIFEYTREYGGKTFNNQTPTNVQFKMKISKNGVTQGASLNIYKTGRIRFSGGYFEGTNEEVRLPLRYVSEQFFNIPRNIPIDINNNTIVLKTNARIKIVPTYATFASGEGIIKFQNLNVKATFEPERNRFINKTKKDSPFLYVSFKQGKQDEFTFIITSPGVIVIEGAKDTQGSIRMAKRFLEAIKDSGLAVEIKNPSLNVSPKKTKMARRLNMKPAPEVTRRGTSCPINRRPTPYSFQGSCPKPRHYVRPNPQGQPCCYKIPKSTKYMENRLENRYNRANVKVPNKVRKTFGVGQNTNNKANNVGKSNVDMEIFFNKKVGKNGKNPVGLKIGSRQCLRFSKVALVDIARRKGLDLPKKLTKPILCDLLSQFAENRRRLPEDLQRNIKRGKMVLRKTKKRTPTPNRAGPSKVRTPTPPQPKKRTPENQNYSSLLNFAKRLGQL